MNSSSVERQPKVHQRASSGPEDVCHPTVLHCRCLLWLQQSKVINQHGDVITWKTLVAGYWI